MSNVKIKAFLESDWETYKLLRLASLIDSPDSFGSTHERESSFSENEWRSRINPATGTVHILPLVAELDDSPIGLACGLVHTSELDSAYVYQMWVSPDYRGYGVGRALLYRILSWAQGLELTSLSLAVTTINLPAVSFYTQFGFMPFGNPEPLREGSPVVIQPMIFKLGTNNA